MHSKITANILIVGMIAVCGIACANVRDDVTDNVTVKVGDLVPIGPIANEEGGGRYAVLILNDDYRGSMPQEWRLKHADKVQEWMREAMAGRLGFATRTIRGDNVTPERIADVLKEYETSVAGPDNVLVVYYYGHGVGIPRSADDPTRELALFTYFTEKQGDLAPRNVWREIELEKLLERTKNAARQRGAELQCVAIIDACYPSDAQGPPDGWEEQIAGIDAKLFSATPRRPTPSGGGDGLAYDGVFPERFNVVVKEMISEDTTASRSLPLDDLVAKINAKLTADERAQRCRLVAHKPIFMRRSAGYFFEIQPTSVVAIPLTGVEIKLGDQVRRIGGADGKSESARFRLERDAEYSLDVTADGFFWRKESVRFSASVHANWRFEAEMVPAFRLIEGTIDDPRQRRLTVRVRAEWLDKFASNKFFRLEETVAAPGAFLLKVPETDQSWTSAVLDIRDGDTTVFTHRLHAAGEHSLADSYEWDPRIQKPRVVNIGPVRLRDEDEATSPGKNYVVGEFDVPANLKFPLHGEGEVLWNGAKNNLDRDNLEQLKEASDKLSRLRNNDHLVPDGDTRNKISHLHDRVILAHAVRQFRAYSDSTTGTETRFEAARKAIAILIAALEKIGLGEEMARAARDQLVVWGSSMATSLEQLGKPAEAIAALESVMKSVSDDDRNKLKNQAIAIWERRVRQSIDEATKAENWETKWREAKQILANARQSYPDHEEWNRLAQHIEREAMPLEARNAIAAGEKAYAAGNLDRAEQHYFAARSRCNPYYAAKVDRQIAEIGARLRATRFAEADLFEYQKNYPNAARLMMLAARETPIFVPDVERVFTKAMAAAATATHDNEQRKKLEALRAEWNAFRDRIGADAANASLDAYTRFAEDFPNGELHPWANYRAAVIRKDAVTLTDAPPILAPLTDTPTGGWGWFDRGNHYLAWGNNVDSDSAYVLGNYIGLAINLISSAGGMYPGEFRVTNNDDLRLANFDNIAGWRASVNVPIIYSSRGHQSGLGFILNFNYLEILGTNQSQGGFRDYYSRFEASVEGPVFSFAGDSGFGYSISFLSLGLAIDDFENQQRPAFVCSIMFGKFSLFWALPERDERQTSFLVALDIEWKLKVTDRYINFNGGRENFGGWGAAVGLRAILFRYGHLKFGWAHDVLKGNFGYLLMSSWFFEVGVVVPLF